MLEDESFRGRAGELKGLRDGCYSVGGFLEVDVNAWKRPEPKCLA